MYNYTKAELANILTVQRIPKNGSVFTPSHFSVHWTSQKALLGKSPMTATEDLWNRLTSLKTRQRNVDCLQVEIKIMKTSWHV